MWVREPSGVENEVEKGKWSRRSDLGSREGEKREMKRRLARLPLRSLSVPPPRRLSRAVDSLIIPLLNLKFNDRGSGFARLFPSPLDSKMSRKEEKISLSRLTPLLVMNSFSSIRRSLEPNDIPSIHPFSRSR